MTALAPTLQAFFTKRLINQRDASPHTVVAYRDTFRLLLAFTHQRTNKQPSALIWRGVCQGGRHEFPAFAGRD